MTSLVLFVMSLTVSSNRKRFNFVWDVLREVTTPSSSFLDCWFESIFESKVFPRSFLL